MTGTDREAEELRAALEGMLSVPQGQRVLFWVLEQAAVYRDAFSGDDAATNYVLGQQSVGRKMIDLMDQIDPRTYPKLLLSIADLKAMDQAAQHMEQQEDDEDA